jgi:hypothetical protein
MGYTEFRIQNTEERALQPISHDSNARDIRDIRDVKDI